MNQILDFLFGSAGVLPRGACLGWQSGLITLHALSDTAIGLAYLGIPTAIWLFVRRRQDLNDETRRLAYLVAAFILVGAVLYLSSVVTLWLPAWGAQGLLKAVAAVVSIVIAVGVASQLSKLLHLSSPRDLWRANAALAETNASLEASITSRTRELEMVKQRFEMALSRSNITVFTQDRDLRYTWIHNPRFGLSLEQIIGQKADDLLPPAAAAETLALKTEVIETGVTASDTLAIPTAQDGQLYLDMTCSPTRDRSGAIDGLLCTAVDVTEKRLFEVRLAAMTAQLGNAYRRFELALDRSPITVFEQDPELRYTFMHNPPAGTSIEDYLDRTDFEIFSEADQRKLVPAKRRVFADKSAETLEVELRINGEQKYYDLRLEPKLDEDGEVEGVIGTALDLTDRRRNEKQMRLVMRELTHRSKNLLAVIQAMARKTASVSEDMDDFISAFSARLRSMAAAHDLLVSHSWSGADLGDVLRASLAQTIDPSSPQVHTDGPPMMLTPDTAQNLGLAFHELTTNASKYGALSADGGQVTVQWRHADGEVRVEWREANGPPVSEADRRGFGRVLLERLVGATLNGSVNLEFRAEGVQCTIAFPEERLIGGA